MEVVIVIAVIAILAALIAPLAVNQVTQARYDACREELKIIKQAIVGDPSLIENGTRSSFGFVGDLGILPRDNLLALGFDTQDLTLGDIMNQNGFQGWSGPPAFSIWFGWRGPYISEDRDPWGNRYYYDNFWPAAPNPTFLNLPLIIARIWSAGPDGVDNNGGNDDLAIEIRTDEAFSMISGNTLDEDSVSVQFQSIILTYPDGGAALHQDPITPVANQVIFNFTNPIPIGVRQIYFLPEVGDVTDVTQFMYINNGPNTTKNLQDPFR